MESLTSITAVYKYHSLLEINIIKIVDVAFRLLIRTLSYLVVVILNRHKEIRLH
jgi:hypothetical protein